MVPRIAAVIFLLLGQSQSLQKPIIGIENLFDSLKGHIDDIFCQYQCRKFEVKACKDDTEKRCTMVYNKECETTEVLDCHDEYRDECKTVYTETCETTYKEKTCKKVPVENCVKKKVPVCQTVPKRTCKNVPKSECHEAHVRKPFSKSVEECKVKEFYEHLRYETKYHNHCSKVPKSVCHTEYHKVCDHQREPVCSTVYEEECRPTYAGPECTKTPMKKCTYQQVEKCHQVPNEICEKHYEEKCVKMPKKVAIKDPKHRCIWPERTISDDHTC